MEIKSNADFEITFILKINETEARALDALVGYGTDVFLREFYKHLGSYYMKPYEMGLRSFFDAIRKNIPGKLSHVENLRKEIAQIINKEK